MFKVGDKVRCIDAEGTTVVSFGKEYEVAEVDGEYLQVLVDGSERGMYAHRFELVEQPWQPKVGDRVRFTKDNPNGGRMYGAKGEIVEVAATINYVSEEYGQQVDIKYPSLTWNPSAPISALEPLPVAEQPAALKIEAGRYYKTRDGRKVGPMQSNGPAAPMWQWYGDNYGNFCRDDGTVHYGDGAPHADDLIAEWVDDAPVAATASNDNAAPAKFKVGDVVVATRDYADVAKGSRYTIIEVDADDEELPIRVKDDAGDGWWLDHDAFEIITPAAPASTTGFTIPLIEDEPEPLTVTLTAEASDLHEELDEIIAKLKKIRKLQRQTGLAA